LRRSRSDTEELEFTTPVSPYGGRKWKTPASAMSSRSGRDSSMVISPGRGRARSMRDRPGRSFLSGMSDLSTRVFSSFGFAKIRAGISGKSRMFAGKSKLFAGATARVFGLDRIMTHQLDRDIDAAAKAFKKRQAALGDVMFAAERTAQRRALLVASMGYIGVVVSWMALCYFSLVYAVKMYKYVGPGSELDFFVAWLQFLALDNFVYHWGPALRKSVVLLTVIHLGDYLAGLVSTYRRYEIYDDKISAQSSNVQVEEDFEDLDID